MFMFGLKVGFILGFIGLIFGFFRGMYKSWKKEQLTTRLITGFLILWFLYLIGLVFTFGNDKILNSTMVEMIKIVTLSSTAVSLFGLLFKSFHKDAKSLSFGSFLSAIIFTIGLITLLDCRFGECVYLQYKMNDVYTLITSTFIFSTPYLTYLIDKRMDEKNKDWKRLKITALNNEIKKLKSQIEDLKKQLKK